MAMSFGASTPYRSDGLLYALLSLMVYLHDHEGTLNTESLAAITSKVNVGTSFHASNRFTRDMVLHELVRRWTHWGEKGAVLPGLNN